MEDLIEAYLSVYEDSDIKSRAKAAVDHQRHGDHGDDDALQKATKAVKKATRYPGRQGPNATPSLPESYDEFDEGFKRMNRGKIERQAKRLGGDKGDILRDVADRMDTEAERKYSTSQARKNRAGAGSEYRKGKELQARDDAKADFKKYGLPETVDLYDVVLDHLLDEGYANTEEDALAIMANMSEEWIDSIFEENDKKQEKGAKWNKGQKLKDPRAQKVFDHMTKKVNETVDLYDVVLEHLLDEGYADTEENAITIMANMSEAWIDGILDEAQIMSVSGPGGLRHMINPNVLKAQNAAARERQGREAREKSKKEAQNAARLDAANRRGIERATNRSDRTDFTPGSALRADERDELPTDYRALRRRAKG
jgi:hypothetical protein